MELYNFLKSIIMCQHLKKTVVILATWAYKLEFNISHLKTLFSETHSKTYLHCEKCKKQTRLYENVGNTHINICKTYSSAEPREAVRKGPFRTLHSFKP